MTSSPLIKPERQGMSFAFVGWTADKTAMQASEFAPVCRRVGICGIWRSARRDRAQFRDFDSQFVGRKEPKFVILAHNLWNCAAAARRSFGANTNLAPPPGSETPCRLAAIWYHKL